MFKSIENFKEMPLGVKARMCAVPFATGAVSALSALPAFAAESSTVVITDAMLQPVVTTITANAGVLIPVGITIMGILVGIGLIPRIIYKFL